MICTYIALIFSLAGSCLCVLQPRESETREIKDLSGMWMFRADYSPSREQSFTDKWFETSLRKTGNVIPMPVPASFNDITTDHQLRDFVGWAWYETEFYVSKDWFNGKRIFLRFGSAHYNAIVWVNSREVMRHSGGHLPFESEVAAVLRNGTLNRLTVAVNNTLTPTTLPPGTITYQNNTNKYPPGYFTQEFQFDFFNYAGIHRPVLLYTTADQYISDVTVKTSINGAHGIVHYNADVLSTTASLTVNIIDADGQEVGYSKGVQGVITVPSAHLWWPFTMNDNPAYLYTLKMSLISNDSGEVLDVYRLPFGIRSVNFTNSQLLINGKPFYCRGLGRHEDSDIRGKGVDLPLIARDYNLIRWLGANCFRTSHYPYAEEIMDAADQQGIVVIDESPGVGIRSSNYGNVSLNHHKDVMEELVARDKNRPSVIMWSVANEPSSSDPAADYYFKEVIATTKMADDTRPVTFVIGPSDYWKEKAAQYVDILCVNHYYAWYSDMGHLEVIGYQLKYDLDMWHKTFNKAIIMSEYGAGSHTDLNSLPASAFTVDYQVEFLKTYHSVFDELRKSYLVGEMVWNFADFMTVQGTTRMYGNRKGIFTRQRQPKPAAYTIRDRYHQLMQLR